MMHTRIEFIKADSELPEAWEQFRLYSTVNGIVNALVHSWQDVAIGFAYANNLGDFPSSILNDTSITEES